MTNIAHDEPIIGRALDVEKMFLMDYEQRIAYIRDIRAMMDEVNHDEGIKREALKEGRAEGRAEGKTEVARKLLEEGFDVEMIEKVTGLSRENVQGIAGRRGRLQ